MANGSKGFQTGLSNLASTSGARRPAPVVRGNLCANPHDSNNMLIRSTAGLAQYAVNNSTKTPRSPVPHATSRSTTSTEKIPLKPRRQSSTKDDILAPFKDSKQREYHWPVPNVRANHRLARLSPNHHRHRREIRSMLGLRRRNFPIPSARRSRSKTTPKSSVSLFLVSRRSNQ